jgi:pyruvate formate lyase activating enzyme
MRLPPSVGLQKTSLLDYPERVASVIFFPGCNMRCPYCHNSGLVLGDREGLIDRDEVIHFLKNRAPLLGGVVISGGEPLLFEGLIDFIRIIREQTGLRVKLDTNGLLADRLSSLLEAEPPDFIAMDIKTSFSNLSQLGIPASASTALKKSVHMIIDSGIPAQFRTTVHPELIRKEWIPELAQTIRGCRDYVLNPFKPGSCLDPAYNEHEPAGRLYLEEIRDLFLSEGVPCRIPSI